MRIFQAEIFWSEPGVMSANGCWVCFHDCYMYEGDTLPGLLVNMLRQWKSEQNLIG